MTTSDSVRPLTAAEEANLRERVAEAYDDCVACREYADPGIRRLLATLDEARAGSLDAAIAAVEALPSGGGLVSRALVIAALREAL